MAIYDAYVSVNMLTGVSFASLLDADYYYGEADWFTAEYADGTDDTFWGYGFTYDIDGTPTGAGTVTGYAIYDDCQDDLLVGIDDINVPVSWFMNAAYTLSTADDIDLFRTILAGDDDVYGSDYADVLDGFGGDDFILAYAGNDIIYGEAGDD